MRLYQISEANKKCGVTITTAGVVNPVNYPDYPPELKLPDYSIRENPFCDTPTDNAFLYVRKPYNQLDYFKIKRSLDIIRGKMKMQLNMLKR